MAGQSALLRHPVISAACLFCLLYISFLSFAPAPFGLYNATAAAAGPTHQAPCEIRSVPTLCVDSWYAFALLVVARLTAYGTYPLLVCLFLTKLNHLRTLLQARATLLAALSPASPNCHLACVPTRAR